MRGKKVVVICLIGLLIVSSLSLAEHDFSDVGGHWAEVYINELASKEITNGYLDGSFNPDGLISIAEFLTFVSKATFGEDNIPYVNGKFWYDKYVDICIDYSILDKNEYSNYDRNITREEMAKIIVRALGKSPRFEETKFDDNDQLTTEKKIYINTCSDIGIIKGYPDNTFKGIKNATRAEASAVISGLMKYTENHKPKKNYNEIYIDSNENSAYKRPKSYFVTEENKSLIYEDVKKHEFLSKNEDLGWNWDDHEIWAAKAMKSPSAFDSNISLASNFIQEYFNRNYQTIGLSYGKDILYGMNYYKTYDGESYHPSDYVHKLIEDTKEGNINVESIFVTDQSLFYYGNRQMMLRGRLFVKYNDYANIEHVKKEMGITKDLNIKKGTWYYVDVDMEFVHLFYNDSITHERSVNSIYKYHYLTDLVEVEDADRAPSEIEHLYSSEKIEDETTTVAADMTLLPSNATEVYVNMSFKYFMSDKYGLNIDAGDEIQDNLSNQLILRNYKAYMLETYKLIFEDEEMLETKLMALVADSRSGGEAQ